MMNPPVIVAVGEVLWDVFSDGAHLGGAPANFAVHCATLGARSFLVSCVGNDDLGRRAVGMLDDRGVVTDWIAVDADHPTGTVPVTLVNGQPGYEIVTGVAWDHLCWTDGLDALAQDASAICFGTLAQRHCDSCQVIQQLVGATTNRCLRVLDINFRQGYHSEDIVRRSLALATVLKLSDEEVSLLHTYVGGSGDVNAFLDGVRKRFDLQWVVLTLGAGGCRVFGADGVVDVVGNPQTVVNAVGAGDAFTAAFIGYLLLGADVKTCAERANAVGGFVVTQEGATPPLPFRIFE